MLVLLSVVATAQSQEAKEKFVVFPSDRTVFVRVGADLSRFALPYVTKIPVYGFELFADTELKYRYFPIVEVGVNNIKHNTDEFNYNQNGYYFRVGMNYNLTKYHHNTDRNSFYVGLRYAYSYSNQEATDVFISNEWGNLTANFDKQAINTNWAEGLFGLRTELFKNIFLGVAIRMKVRISITETNNLTPYFIPGFGKGANKINTGMSYTLSYAIPIVKRK